ncbi:bile acid:sodium symporter family protein [Candidatus Pelagibacter sp.]|nr:bile acid:sodium symporter family protein [Candidatus Pelagibacter sp.]
MGIVTTIAPFALALIMLGLGASLTINDFIRVFQHPKEFFVGLICQIVVLPIIGYLLIIILKTPIELALGVMLIAAAPGGVTSNVLTKFANGDVALSISLTAFTSLISIVSVPYIVFLSIDLFDITYVEKEVSMLGISLKMFFVVTIPVIIGMIIRKVFNNFIENNMKYIEKISIGLFCVVFIAIYIEEWDSIIMFMTTAGTVSLILNISMMVIGFYVAKFFASSVAKQRCISLECGLQNGTLAVFVGTQLFGQNMTYMIPTAAYALIMMATSVIFVIFLRKRN